MRRGEGPTLRWIPLYLAQLQPHLALGYPAVVRLSSSKASERKLDCERASYDVEHKDTYLLGECGE